MMNKRNYKKTIALTAAALSVFEIGAMCGNVVKLIQF